MAWQFPLSYIRRPLFGSRSSLLLSILNRRTSTWQRERSQTLQFSTPLVTCDIQSRLSRRIPSIKQTLSSATFEKHPSMTRDDEPNQRWLASEDQGLKLLGVKESPFVIRVMLSLDLKGIPYDFVEENLQNKSELLLKTNPIYKKFPVLIHDGKPVCESQVILQYVEEVWPSSAPHLLPTDPYDRALARFWGAFIDDKLVESVRRILANPDEQSQKKATDETQQNLGYLEEALKTTFAGKAYFGGDKVGYLDIVLGSLYASIKSSENIGNVLLVDDSKTPLLNAWLTKFAETEGVKGLLPDPAMMTEFYKKLYHSQ